jgi:hypothetical protein
LGGPPRKLGGAYRSTLGRSRILRFSGVFRQLGDKKHYREFTSVLKILVLKVAKKVSRIIQLGGTLIPRRVFLVEELKVVFSHCNLKRFISLIQRKRRFFMTQYS